MNKENIKNNICYIVLTCEKFIETRVKWQNDTFFKNVDKKDVYFISSVSHTDSNIYGWNTADNYESCPMKYICFFKNMLLDYEWYCFIDDDTFIHTNNLNKFLQNYNSSDPLYIGKLCNNYNPPFYMSGGAGFILSKPVYLHLLNYIRCNTIEELCKSIYGDLSIGLWLKNSENNFNIVKIDNEHFNSNIHTDESNLTEFISFHYLKTFEEFEFYNKLKI